MLPSFLHRPVYAVGVLIHESYIQELLQKEGLKVLYQQLGCMSVVNLSPKKSTVPIKPHFQNDPKNLDSSYVSEGKKPSHNRNVQSSLKADIWGISRDVL